jgi:DhnA family fructose-bisphosphate aldolase class Ia
VNNLGKAIRLRRLLRNDRCTLVVAFDHALVLGPIPGTRDPRGQIQRFALAGADAILLNLGLFQHCVHPQSTAPIPPLIARLDWTTAFSEAGRSDSNAFRSCLLGKPEDAMQAGADAVITYMTIGSGNLNFERDEIARTAQIARDCERIGLPLIVETIARGPAVKNPVDPSWLLTHTRRAVELGADAIKTEFTGDAETMREVVEACPIPILVLGGTRMNSDEEVVRVTGEIVRSGAAGIFFGRNIFQSEHMPQLMQKIHAVLRESPTQRG